MPIPSLITDLSTVAASNSPAGGEPPGQGDDHLRAHAAFIRQLYDSKLTESDLPVIKVSGTGVAATDAANLSAANALGLSTGKAVVAVGAFTLTTKLIISCQNFDGSAATLTTDPTLATAVEVRASTDLGSGPTLRPAYLRNARIVLPKILASTFAFTGIPGDLAAWGARGEGVRIHNCITCDITIPQVYGFGVGVRVAATGGGTSTACSWNQIHYGEISNNLVNLLVEALDTSGFCNENNHYGGRFCHTSPISQTNITGCTHHKIRATGSGANSQKFFSPSIEGDAVQWHIDSEEGYSAWLYARGEAYTLSVPQVRFSGASARNNSVSFGAAFGKPNISQSSGAQLNQVDWIQGIVEDGSITTAVRVMRNTAALAVFGVVRASQDPHTATTAEMTVRITEDEVGVKSPADTNDRIAINYQGRLLLGSGSAAADVLIGRQGAGLGGALSGGGKLGAVAGLWVGNSVTATTLGTIVKKVEIFDSAGASLGYVPVVSTI